MSIYSWCDDAVLRDMEHQCGESCVFKYIHGSNPMRFQCSVSKNVHICDDTCCLRSHNKDATLVCPISGRCFEQTMNTNQFQRQTRVQFSSIDTLRRHQAPLRSSKPSKRRSKSSKAKFCGETVRKLLKKLLPQNRLNTDRCNYYVGVVKSMWELSTNASCSSVVSTECCTLGTIYLLQYGLCHKDKQLLPKDPFLFNHLPAVTDLVKYNLKKKGIRIGKNQILKCLRDSRVATSFVPIEPYSPRL